MATSVKLLATNSRTIKNITVNKPNKAVEPNREVSSRLVTKFMEVKLLI